MHRNTRTVLDAAHRLGLQIQPVDHPDGTRTAEDAARAIGVDVAQIVKSLVFDVVGSDGSQRPVIALVSGADRLDEARLALAAGADRADRVDAARVRAVTGFPIGGVPPFGHPEPVSTFVDPGLLVHDEVWAAAGTPQAVFGLAPEDLVAVTGATVADLAAE